MRFYETRETFDDRVLKGPGCWLWLGALNELGYGRATWKGKTQLAHRVAWMRAAGEEIPRGLLVLHACDTPACVRPDHLRLGTHAENAADKMARGRHVVRTGSDHWTRYRPDALARGGAVGTSKLSEADAQDILNRAAAGERQRDIAALYGVSNRTVSAIVTGVSWKHLRVA